MSKDFVCLFYNCLFKVFLFIEHTLVCQMFFFSFLKNGKLKSKVILYLKLGENAVFLINDVGQ